MSASVAIIGEGMLELSHAKRNAARLGYGGDTLNTAVYMARLGVRPQFISALGEDPYSRGLRDSWTAEGIDTQFVLTHPSRLPGLYAIQTDANGERSFFYWREQSAMRDFFALEAHIDALHHARQADWLYLSGITLSLFEEAQRRIIFEIAAAVRARGGQVVFDPNYRPTGWSSAEHASKCFAGMAEHVSLALPTLDDEQALHGAKSPRSHAEAWLAAGVEHVVLKRGAEGAVLFARESDPVQVLPARTLEAIDSTGAGDSFNAALLVSLINGTGFRDAIDAGNRLAGKVIRHRGAILKPEDMPRAEARPRQRSDV